MWLIKGQLGESRMWPGICAKQGSRTLTLPFMNNTACEAWQLHCLLAERDEAEAAMLAEECKCPLNDQLNF